MTRKELIEKGYIDQYVLGLTTEEENVEVERLANLYPEIQEKINETRLLLCSNFNRNLTQPALRSSLLTKRRVLLWSGLIVSFFSIGFCVLCREHFSLQENFTIQQAELAREHAKATQLASLSRAASEQSDFLHAERTERIKLKGGDKYPEAEVMIFHDDSSGKMMLRVIDLPSLKHGEYYEVWANQPDSKNVLVGRLTPPVRFDSLYNLAPVLKRKSLEITSVDPYTNTTTPICAAELK